MFRHWPLRASVLAVACLALAVGGCNWLRCCRLRGSHAARQEVSCPQPAPPRAAPPAAPTPVPGATPFQQESGGVPKRLPDLVAPAEESAPGTLPTSPPQTRLFKRLPGRAVAERPEGAPAAQTAQRSVSPLN